MTRNRPLHVRAAGDRGRTGRLLVTLLAVVLAGAAIAGCGSKEPATSEQKQPSTATTSVEATSSATGTTEPTATAPARTDDGSLAAAQKVVQDFYAALNAHDTATVTELLVADQREGFDAATVAAWAPNTFTFVRSLMEGANAAVYGREKMDAFGAAPPGGVKFVLVRQDGAWYVSDMKPADQGQVTGETPKTTTTGGLKGALTDASARTLMTQLLKARQKGDGATVRKLTTAKFQTDNGDVWLDGVDNTMSFTAFSITSVKISGSTATVVVSETWPDGTAPSTYGLVAQSGSIFVNSWQP